MNKAAPSPARILTMVVFALSCFGLLVFLWLSFGGPIPLKPKGYRVNVAFDEATQLAVEADVRSSGVSIGKVRAKKRDPKGGRTLATLEIERRFAPLREDARAILRSKTLLGETFVELTQGSKQAPFLEENSQLANDRVQPTVELNEILDSLDPSPARPSAPGSRISARPCRTAAMISTSPSATCPSSCSQAATCSRCSTSRSKRSRAWSRTRASCSAR